ncbi:hypothetical protein C7S18_08425 [Ahniella affigens]|uniref:Porin n=1 Tax=Ahniella affigens TaxID=2021234 RepID=A0A2P1PQU9_9GAMM|nr:hypothetical protein [Ahniella affigens]AVP97219.1 hypothetical protein C7S18_08425 [Ahniella affigens]
MRNWLTVPTIVMGAASAPAWALETTTTLSVSTMMTSDPSEDQARNLAGVSALFEAQHELGGWTLTGLARAEENPERDRNEYDDTVALLELRAQRALGPIDLTLGRQLVRGGRATLVNPTDVFDARDSRDALLATDRVRAVDAMRLAWFLDNWQATFVTTPVHTKSLMPHPDSRWFFQLPASADLGDGTIVPIAYSWADYDATHLGAPQTQFKLNHEGEGFSYALSWFDGEDTLPTFDSRAPILGPSGLQVEIDQTFAHKQAWGADAELLVGKAVLRIEAARIKRRFEDGRRDDYDHIVAGFDLSLEHGLFGQETYLAFEYSKQFARDGQDWNKEDLRHILANAFLARVDVTLGDHDSVVADVVYDHLQSQNALLFEYRHGFNDQLDLFVTTDVLGGDAETFFGQYTRNDRLGLRLEYTF